MSPQPDGRPIEILLVDDDPGDILITTEALQHSKVTNNLHSVTSGEEALAFLRREGSHAGAARPDLVLLDLNLPRRNGHEVLAAIAAADDLRDIPVVVLTTSQAEEDILRSHRVRADAYVTKPVDFARLVEVVRSIDELHFTIVRRPAS